MATVGQNLMHLLCTIVGLSQRGDSGCSSVFTGRACANHHSLLYLVTDLLKRARKMRAIAHLYGPTTQVHAA